MFKRLGALLWSRKEVILANKMVVTNLLMPLLMVVLYQFMFKGKEGSERMILFMVLPMVPAFVGYILPTLISEEAEKNNQRTLRLAGVNSWEYVLASLVFPVLLNLFYLVALPVYLKMSWSDLGWQYLVVMLLSSLVIFLLFMTVALLVDSQARASIVAMPIMMLTAFLPIFALTDQSVGKVIVFTHMGSFSSYSEQLSDYSLLDKSFLALLVWLTGGVVSVLWAMRKKRTLG